MLKIVDETPKKWAVLSSDLRKLGMRSPQGFSFQFGSEADGGNFWWTTNEFAAYLFYKRYGCADAAIIQDFKNTRAKELYLHKLSSAVTSDKVFKSPPGFEYRPHQRAGIEFCTLAGNVLVADEQRIGKTAIAIGAINNLPDIDKVLILCPKTAKAGWELELKNWLIEDKKIQVLNSQSEIDDTADIYIANYDILHIQKDLQKIHFSLVVPDECHLIARADARRTKFFLELDADKIIALSGTPLLNSPKDLLTIAQWLDPFWKQFFCKQNVFISESGITLTLDEVQEFLRSSVMIRRLQAQVFDNEPPIVHIVPIETPANILDLVQVEKNGYKNLNKLEDYTKARRIIGINKVPYAINHINTYTTEGEKLVVFAHHKPVIERIASSLGRKAVTIYGQSTDKEREEAKQRFNKDPECQVLVGSVKAASMALNLSVSCHIIFVEIDWANWAMEQAKERCSDKLQTKQIIIEYLAFDKSLDYYMLNKVDLKNTVVDKGLDLIYA